MNATVNTLFAEYLDHTGGDKAAAASLTLAAVMMESQAEAPVTSNGLPLTVKEAAGQLRVSTRRIYELCAAGTLRAFKVGRRLRIAPEMLEEYQRQGRVVVHRPETFGNRRNRCL